MHRLQCRWLCLCFVAKLDELVRFSWSRSCELVTAAAGVSVMGRARGKGKVALNICALSYCLAKLAWMNVSTILSLKIVSAESEKHQTFSPGLITELYCSSRSVRSVRPKICWKLFPAGALPREHFPPGHVLPGRFLPPYTVTWESIERYSGIIFSVSMVKECSKHQILLCYL